MAGLTTAWRLSEPGWQDRFESITVYQRGWRLGGKAASSRGDNGRIEEHGLHVWIGSYENAFTLIRECYAELDRPTTDPTVPIGTWRQAFIPANEVGATDRWNDEWQLWLGRFTGNDELPGEPDGPAGQLDVVHFVQRGLQLIGDFADSLQAMGEFGLTLSTSAEMPSKKRSLDAVRTRRPSRLCHAHRPTGKQRGTARPIDSRAGSSPRNPRLRDADRPSAVVDPVVAGADDHARSDRRRSDDRPARFPSHQRRGLRRLGDPSRRPSGRPGVPRPARDVQHGLRLRERPIGTPDVCGRCRDAARRVDVLHLQGCDLLEDDCRHGRCRDGPHVRGAAAPRRQIRVLSSPRCPSLRPEPTQRRGDLDGAPGPVGRRCRRVRPADPGAPAPRFPAPTAS